MADDDLLQRITALVDQEHNMRAAGSVDATRLARLEATLDQCWDLLRQRRARVEYDQPDTAQVRPPGTVEGYQQ